MTIKNNNNYSGSAIILGLGGKNILYDFYSKEGQTRYCDNLFVSEGMKKVISVPEICCIAARQW